MNLKPTLESLGCALAAVAQCSRNCLLWLLGIVAWTGLASAAALDPASVWVEPVTGMAFVRVDKGCFAMGTKPPAAPSNPPTLVERDIRGDYTADERPQHQVCVAEYWMGRHEVRADEWEKLMKSPPPHGRGAEPATGISWNDARRFAGLLTAAGDGRSEFRLPTEAEWEMACLAGQAELVTGEHDVDALRPTTVFAGGYRGRAVHPRPQAVASRQANPWGLLDMRGNASEWVLDAYAKDGYRRHVLFDPVIENVSGQRVLRGGSHRSETIRLRCASRSWYFAAESLPAIGMRLVRKARP